MRHTGDITMTQRHHHFQLDDLNDTSDTWVKQPQSDTRHRQHIWDVTIDRHSDTQNNRHI